QRRMPSFSEKFAVMKDILRNDLHFWGFLQRGIPCKIDFVLQPVLFWTGKKLTPIEQQIFQADAESSTAYQDYINKDLYLEYASFIQDRCRSAGIDYHDANTWLNGGQFDTVDLFTDVCH